MTRRWLFPAVTALVGLLAVSCSGDDGDALPTDSTSTTSSTSSTSTTSPTTTIGGTGSTSSSTTTEQPAGGSGTLLDTTLRSDDVTVSYELHLDGSLCFRADIDSTNPTLAATFVDAVDDCLDDVAALDEPLSATVGALDGDQLFGYIWGRAGTDVARLELRFADDSTVDVELIDTDQGVRVFAAVLDTRTGAAVESLRALDGAGNELAAVSVVNFLRAGPTYPTVTPSTVPPPTYPTSS